MGLDIEHIKSMLLSNHNLILTGAPGTGKTYTARKVAESMNAIYKVVQFHPSYDYADFVEGLRPKNDDGQIRFERVDGVFKEFCKKAISSNPLDDYLKKPYKLSLNGHQWQLESGQSGRIVINTGYSKVPQYVLYSDILNTAFVSTDTIDRNWFETQLNNTEPAFDEQKTKGISRLYDEIYKALLQQPYVFIIDEINRGEVSKIFGELFSVIDPDCRGEKFRVDTQYQTWIPKGELYDDGFYVPDNVYVIGTMNDIDRSVESIDFAIRRRFAWKEISAEDSMAILYEEKAWGGKKPENKIISGLTNRMHNLNKCIIDEYQGSEGTEYVKIGLSKAYQIGAAYFLKYRLYDKEHFERLWNYHIKSLLQEYLRGSSDCDRKIEALKTAYNDTSAH